MTFSDAFVDAPLPDVPGTRRLDYTHFTVLLDPVRRLAALTAVNIDGDGLRDLPRRGEWFLDDRVPESEQCGNELYRDNDLDRGHLVRRRDPQWGPDAEAAGHDTFSYANAAPQAADFNQSKELWLGLEDHVLAYADANDHRVSVFTGCVFAEDDPSYRGVLVPRRFWKVAAWRSSEGLATAAFVLDQSTMLKPAMTPVRPAPLGRFRTFQVPVAEVQRLTGIDLGVLEAADVLEPVAAARPVETWRRLRSAGDIRL
ncbi:MAG TPA: DNA/RNA non-specific endonuclease [Rhodoglobus sp.]|nr:DNA/RNA non-specific endonuclease [Rhodoglobus sp.]